MEPQEPEKQEKPGETSPLKVELPKVARFNRRMVVIVAATASAILTFALVTTFSPKKRAEGQAPENAKTRKRTESAPGLPDPMVNAPGKYNEVPKRRRPSSTYSGQTAGARAAGEPGVGEGTPQRSPSYEVTPEEQARAKEQEQTQKDAASAINSPVTFGQNDTPAPPQARAEEPRGEATLPSLQGLTKITDRISAPGGSSDDQNMQGEKRDFARERGAEFPYVKATLLAPLSPYEIKAGTLLPAILITGINSDLPGQLVAQLRENVYDTVTGNYLLIPQGTRLIGEYDSKVAFGQERVLIVWTRLIMPNGSSLKLEGMPGADLSGYAGATGKVNNHYGKLVTGVVLGSIIGAGAQVAVGGQGAPNVPASFGQMAVSGAAQNINQSAQQHTNKVLNMQPTIEVAPGDKINVFVTKDMILQPFTE